MKRILFITAMLFFLSSSSAYADIYCGNDFISASDPFGIYTTQKIIKLCGKPTKVKRWETEKFFKTYYGFDKIITRYAVLTYNRGSNTLVEYLIFRNNKLISVADGNYGSP